MKSAPLPLQVRASLSLPSWERGLKFGNRKPMVWMDVVAPLVGAWIEIVNSFVSALCISVAPLVGAWIEIDYVYKNVGSTNRRSPRGSVD